MYSAINIDTKKALEAIRESREYQINASALRVQKEQAYMEGVNKGLDIAEGLFRCSNYEKEKESSYTDGIKDAFFEIGKELDIKALDILESTSSVDEACVLLSDRIRKRLLEENTDDAN
jgi:hypothetical protein|uniref:Uncharacterized protein n=1 Tax=Phage sp. ctXnn1 TaxID=2826749 RepID=A0A8S5N904_9VIRU|nr:MAG TPA: hypothetical protein [Phage sp. ctXnn1]